MLKNIFTLTISSVAMAFIVGCSNQSPVSVAETSNTPSEQAYVLAGGGGSMFDIGAFGGCIYVVNANDPATPNDFYIYRFNNPTASWVKTSHWGRRVAIQQSGRCYHFNSYNSIWVTKWKNESDSTAYVTDGPATKTIKDIGVGSVGSSSLDYIWIICTDNTCWRCQVQSGQAATAWEQISQYNYAYANSIYAQGDNGNNVVIGTNAGVAIYQYGYFNLKTGNNMPTSSITDVAITGNTIFFEPYDHCLSKKDITTSDSPTSLTCDTRNGNGLSCDVSKYYYADYLYQMNVVNY
jgi:hypothetical protein